MNRSIASLSRGMLARMRGVEWNEVIILLAVLAVLLCGCLVVKLADEVREGATKTVDEWVLQSLRDANHPTAVLGPAWIREASLDLTALGSPAVLILTVAAVASLMCLQRRSGLALFTVLTTLSGWAVLGVLKHFIGRERPTIGLHLREVSTSSFPSGHAMLSAIVYLTLGSLAMQEVTGRAAKLYCLTGAALLTLLVGISRVHLGVHYPTDVLAGWTAGVGWALNCWIIHQYFWRRGFSTLLLRETYKQPL